jgi:UPF0271 protein
MKSIDLNCDMGELKSGQPQNFDKEIMPYISSCNIACGFHSGRPELIESTIRAAIANGVQIGAHPSYNDPKDFGRRSLKTPLRTLLPELRYQIAAIKGMVESLGATLNHIKPHGALYNDMAADRKLAAAFVALIGEIDPQLKIFALAHSELVEACKAAGIRWISEGFADRRYQKINQLRSRQLEESVLHDPPEILRQVDDFLRGQVILHNGTHESIQVQSICLHSDTQGAVHLSKIIHQYLKENAVNIAAIV